MNCEKYQRRLLEALDPEEPPAEFAAHLTDCPACRAWQRRLSCIERHVPLLPVPESEGKARFLLRALNDPDLLTPRPVLAARRPLPMRRIALGLGGVAAAVAVLVGGAELASLIFRSPENQSQAIQAKGALEKSKLSTGHTQGTSPTTAPMPAATLVARLMDCNVRLAQADTLRQRVEMLADMADVLRDEAKTLGNAAAPEALETVAVMYGKVVRDGIVPRARALPNTERREVLNPIAARLALVENDVEAVARNAGPTTAERLRRVSIVAREGDVQLRALVREGAP
jgi:hypothetical protein